MGLQRDDLLPTAADTERIPAEAEYWLALSRLPGMGRISFLKLIGVYHSARAAWDEIDSSWIASGAVRSTFDSSGSRSTALAWGKDQIDKLAKSNWTMTALGDPRYPASISSITHPPPYLFVRGQCETDRALGVVGSRSATEYGVRITRQLVGEIAAAGIVIVSGFAQGIDTVAHTTALEASGQTIAVWGCGPDVIYPSENRALAERIVAQGMLVTEFPFGAAPERHHFPIRNRLIAALSDGVLVTQARARSGALLTAEHAVEQGKNVYAIPGEIGRDQFVGSHELLKQGARIVTSADDILSDFELSRAPGINKRATMPMPTLTDIEKRVYDGLGTSACPIDRLAVSLNLPAGECARVLVGLELKGVITRSAGGVVARAL
ncbi:MAG TPA: DNA-processing protein DprA [candidate division Zixibacteria bacterium]|jgi:DNA processing protein